MAYYANTSLIGANFNASSTTQLFALGTKAQGSDGTEWIYCQAASAVTAFKAVQISVSHTCAMASAADVLDGVAGRLGWAQFAFAASEFGWVPVSGVVYVMTTGSNTLTASGVPVCLGGSAVSTGMISMVATTTNTLQGISILAHGSGGQTATATAAKAIISWPRAVRPSVA